MYKKILVPVDGSKRAEAIFPHVSSLATRLGAEVVLLKVDEENLMLDYDEVVDTCRYEAEQEALQKQTQGYLQACRQALEAKGLRVRTRVACGPVSKTISHVADEEHACMIALACRGLLDAPGRGYGSVTACALHNAGCPLFVIEA